VGPLKTEVNNGSLQYSEGERANEQYEKVHDVKDAILLSIPKLAIQKTRFLPCKCSIYRSRYNVAFSLAKPLSERDSGVNFGYCKVQGRKPDRLLVIAEII